jgi:hydroxyacylglutathione hydrolase
MHDGPLSNFAFNFNLRRYTMGCGRLFEGSAADMWTSVQKIMSMPEHTVRWCRLTLSNPR